MKKGTIATIIGIAMVLGLALSATPLSAGWSNCPATNLGNGIFLCAAGPGDCSAALNTIEPDPGDLLSYSDLRSNTYYDSEDDTYMYFNCTYNPLTQTFTPSQMGTDLLGVPKEWIDYIIEMNN